MSKEPIIVIEFQLNAKQLDNLWQGKSVYNFNETRQAVIACNQLTIMKINITSPPSVIEYPIQMAQIHGT
jgi:hypothetical protein